MIGRPFSRILGVSALLNLLEKYLHWKFIQEKHAINQEDSELIRNISLLLSIYFEISFETVEWSLSRRNHQTPKFEWTFRSQKSVKSDQSTRQCGSKNSKNYLFTGLLGSFDTPEFFGIPKELDRLMLKLVKKNEPINRFPRVSPKLS